MIFKKYEFESEAKWLEVKKTLYITEIIDDEEVTYLRPEVNAIVEIGHICHAHNEEGECTDLSTMYAVDMLLNEPLDTLDGYLVYPNPDTVKHTFSGDNFLWVQTYCTQYPEYCETPEEE